MNLITDRCNNCMNILCVFGACLIAAVLIISVGNLNLLIKYGSVNYSNGKIWIEMILSGLGTIFVLTALFVMMSYYDKCTMRV